MCSYVYCHYISSEKWRVQVFCSFSCSVFFLSNYKRSLLTLLYFIKYFSVACLFTLFYLTIIKFSFMDGSIKKLFTIPTLQVCFPTFSSINFVVSFNL